MKAIAAVLLSLVLVASANAGFTYLYSMNGSNPDDGGNYFAFSQPTGVLFANGRLFVADSGKSALYVMNGTARARAMISTGTSSELANPLRMAYDGGIVYIADGVSGRIKMYRDDGTPIDDWTLGTTNLGRPSGIALDQANAYITDAERGNLFVYSRATRAYASTGLAKGGSDGLLSSPADVEIYNGQVFISDSGKKLLFAYDRNLTFQYTIGRSGDVALTSPRGFAIYQDRIYVADASSNRIVSYTMDGYPVEILDAGTAGGNFSYPEDVAIADGKMYVADSGNRLVKVFGINQTAGNGTVLGAINLARSSLSSLSSLQEVAGRLNISYDPGTVAEDVDSAQSYYDRFMFTTASNLAQKAIDGAASRQASLSQKIEVKTRKIAKDAQDSVAQYRTGAKGAVASKISQLDNMAADVNAKTSAKMYSAAADTALAMPGVTSEIAEAAKNSSEKEAEREQNMTVSLFYIQANTLGLRLAQLEAKAATYRQPMDTANVKSLINTSMEYAQEGDFDAANRSLSLAALEIGAFEHMIGANSEEVGAALINISACETAFNATVAKPTLVPTDIGNERAQLIQAKETAYANPSLALIMAHQASESAAKKVAEAQTLSVAVAALLIMFGLILVISTVFYLHLRRRKRKGGL